MNADNIRNAIQDSSDTIRSLASQADIIRLIGDAMVKALKSGNKVLTAGNGGSAAEALHMAEELTGRFRSNRPSLPGIALVADATALTCIGNDYGFDYIFSRQVEGLAKQGDVLVLFSTSGRAANLVNAARTARERGAVVVALLGKDGGPLRGMADFELIVKGQATERIQEAHQVILHLLLEAVEQAFVLPA